MLESLKEYTSSVLRWWWVMVVGGFGGGLGIIERVRETLPIPDGDGLGLPC